MSVCLTYLPPSCSSAVACTISHSLLMKHWYIPWSSFCSGRIMSFSGDEVISNRLSRTIGFALRYHEMRVRGCPPVMHWNTASFPTSTTCVCGCTWADNGAANATKDKLYAQWHKWSQDIVLFTVTQLWMADLEFW